VDVYRELLGDAQVRAVSLAVLLSGVGGGAVGLALVLLVRAETGSFATAGAVVAALGVASGVFSPIRGRLVDARGQRKTLIPLAGIHLGALVGFVALASAHAPTWSLILAAAIAGAAPAPLMSSLRAMWRDLVPDARLQAAYALQAVLTEILFVVSPVLAALLVTAFSAQLAVLVLAILEFAGVVAFSATTASRSWRSEPRETGHPLGALVSPGMRTLVVSTLPYGIVFGALDVAAPAFADLHGAAEAAGIALAALALGSMAGGLIYGSGTWPWDLPARYLVLSVALAALLALSSAAGGLPLFALSLAVAGLMVAPTTTIIYSLLDRVAPRGTATEATTWMILGYAVGTAAGASIAGVAVERSGVTLGILVASAGALLSGLVFLTRLATLNDRRPSARYCPSMSEENVETVRRVYEGVNARLEVPRELFDPDYEFDNTELWPDIDGVLGFDAAQEAMREYWQTFEGYRVEIEEVIYADEGRVVDVVRDGGRMRGTDSEIWNRFFHVWTLRDGRIVRLSVHTDRNRSLEAAGLAEQRRDG
jgi:MFS family permease